MKRMRRQVIRLSAVIVLTVCLLGIDMVGSGQRDEHKPVFLHQANAYFDQNPWNDDETLDVFVVRRYLCGEETIYRGRLHSEEIKRIVDEETVSFGWRDDARLYFTEEVDDLSSDCKKNAYFGMDPDGNLSLFNGLPEKKRVIRTFFQLDIEHLESSLPDETIRQLYEGIRISDFNEYKSVLSTFSPYAIER